MCTNQRVNYYPGKQTFYTIIRTQDDKSAVLRQLTFAEGNEVISGSEAEKTQMDVSQKPVSLLFRSGE